MRVAIQGIRGSYSEEAASRILGESLDLIECSDFSEAFREAEIEGTLVVIPVRNSIVGRIDVTNALIESSGFKILDQIDLRVEHVLAGARDIDISDVAAVRSHPEALKQCGKFLSANPHIIPENGNDTASSIRDSVTLGDPKKAAIGSRRAAAMYGAHVLYEHVADTRDNRTTFYLLGK